MGRFAPIDVHGLPVEPPAETRRRWQCRMALVAAVVLLAISGRRSSTGAPTSDEEVPEAPKEGAQLTAPLEPWLETERGPTTSAQAPPHALGESSAALPRTGRWLNHDITRCCDGLGATFDFLRASLFYVLEYNLTFVHYPPCATHGANATAIDEWLGMGDADPSCGSRCVTRAVEAGTLRKVSYMQRGGRQTLESVLATGGEELSTAIKAEPGDGVVFELVGCPKFTLVTPATREWFFARYQRAREAAPARLAFGAGKVAIAIHFRAGGIVGSPMFDGRWTTPAWYIAMLKRLFAVSSLDVDAKSGNAEVFLFSEGKRDEPHFVEFLAAIPELQLRLGTADSSVRSDVDHLSHLAAAHVLITAHSSLSLLAATLSDGAKLVHRTKQESLRTSPGITRKVYVDDGGSFDAVDFLEACALAVGKPNGCGHEEFLPAADKPLRRRGGRRGRGKGRGGRGRGRRGRGRAKRGGGTVLHHLYGLEGGE